MSCVYIERRKKLHTNDMLLVDGYRMFITPNSTLKKVTPVTPACLFTLLRSSLEHDRNDNGGDDSNDSECQCYNGENDCKYFKVRNDVVVPRLVVLPGWESRGSCDSVQVVAIVAVVGGMCVV